MIYVTDFNEAKKLLFGFIKARDFSKPFILAGPSGVGKSDVIKSVKAECATDFDVAMENEPLEDWAINDYVQSHSQDSKARVIVLTVCI